MSEASIESARVAVVTGAGKGLGAAFAKACAAQGMRVVVNNRRRPGEPSSADATVAEIVGAGGAAVADYGELNDPSAAEALVRTALDTFGRLDALVLNAGINGSAAKVSDLPEDELRLVLDTNFFANHRILQAALPALTQSPAPRIVFVSSTAGLYGVRGRAAYAASKGALNAYALTLADELRRKGIGVNIIAPYAATAMTVAPGDPPPHPLLTPANAAAVAAWMASEACQLTGEIRVTGGGWVRRARTVEARGAGAGARISPAWLDANHDAIADLHDAREFAGAEAAFADLFKFTAASERARDHGEDKCQD